MRRLRADHDLGRWRYIVALWASLVATPAAAAPDPDAPVVGQPEYITAFNTPIVIDLGLIIGSRSPFTLQVSSPPMYGTATASGTVLTYTPASNYIGWDHVGIRATNATATGDGTVYILVQPPSPVARGDVATVVQNVPTRLRVTDNDLWGPFLSIAIVRPPSSGLASPEGLQIIYFPAHDFLGTDSFTYTVTNVTGTSAPATVTVSVGQHAPVANSDYTVTTLTDPVTIDVTANDENPPFSAVNIVQQPYHGTATLSGNRVIYVAEEGFFGSDNFFYSVTNAAGTSPFVPAVVLVRQREPVAVDDFVTVPGNVTSVLEVTANDLNGPFAYVTPFGLPAHGTLTYAGELTLGYTPNPGYVGPDAFSYTASNIPETSAPGNVLISVSAPVAPRCTIVASPPALAALGDVTLTAGPATPTTSVTWDGGFAEGMTGNPVTGTVGGTTSFAATLTTGADNCRASITIPVAGMPSSPPPPGAPTGTAVEYYNAGLDHYFITTLAEEMTALDGGVLHGWARTGQVFSMYMGGPVVIGMSPVCRFYGLPAAGLDSHFYSAAPGECAKVQEKFAASWKIESFNIGYVYLPNPQTSACPVGTRPVYRSWNNRSDSNHRYTTDPDVQEAMLAKGYVAEGYGNPAVAFCVPE